MKRRLIGACFAAIFGLGSVPAHAQVVVDEGAFIVLRSGQPVGTESYSIRRSGFGDNRVLVAQGTVEWDRPRRRATVRTLLRGRDLDLAAFEAKVSGDVQAETGLQMAGRRFVLSSRTDDGMTEQEFRAVPGAVVLEPGVAHLYALLALRAPDGGSVPVIVPARGRALRAEVSVVGAERVEVDGRALPARHLRVEIGGAEHHVWLDEEGHLLRVHVPDADFDARRRERP
ncbi:MAG: hypothetical protein D6701_11845 [Gemmatimonadetes bacterium]|nr:MAG: hypothetical protein D6701_11845 [Gemmatimonadota bacterium]